MYTGMVLLGAGVVLLPRFPLITVMFLSQVVNGILLPFVLIFVLVLINKKQLMGDAVNGPVFNVIAWVTVVVMIVLTLLLVANGFGLTVGKA
jgi:Mn2+/Fe2+ NRAMP family transporter